MLPSMEPSCIRQTLIPGTSKLFADYLYHFDRVSCFYPLPYFDPESFQVSASQVNFPESRRAQIVSALRRQNGDSPNLAKLAQPGTVAVLAGQQVGFLSGPAYTIFKALTAVKLAGRLTERGIRAVPVFWLATEDHDLAEVDHAWVFDQEATPTKLAVTNAVVNGGPVGCVQFNEVPLEQLRDGLGELPFADDVVSALAKAYRPGATFGSAFRSFLQELLKDCDLLYLDPSDPAVRETAAPFARETVERVPELVSALRNRNSELERAGYHTQVHVEDSTSLLFLLTEGKRIAIRYKDGQFTARDRSYMAGDLCELADLISPNALLRPVMQDFLLPTAAYVGGPAEIAYLAQSEVLYQKLLGRMPVIFPRNAFTLLDARASKLLDRYRIYVPDLLDFPERAKSRIAARLVPPKLSEELAALQSTVSEAVAKTQSSLSHFDVTLEAAAKKSMAKILYQVDKLTQRTARETMRRDERASRDANFLMNLIYPQRHPQERFYSIVPFLAKHGLDLPRRLLEMTQLVCPDHMVRTI
jgi:bacillithiol synthase